MAKSLSQLRSIRVRIRTCSIEFQQHVVTFCQLTGTHPDLDIRFLGIRIAFNGHYELKKPKKSSKSVRG
jgi:gamma-tubulin complex component 3